MIPRLLVALLACTSAVAAPVPKLKDDGLIWLHNTKTNVITAYTPAGKVERTWTLKDGVRFLGLTADGTKLQLVKKKERGAEKLTLHFHNVNQDIYAETNTTDTGFEYQDGATYHTSPDGKQVVRVRHLDLDANSELNSEHTLFDLATKKETKVTLPANHYLLSWSDDGKTWLLHEYVHPSRRNPNLPRYRMLSVPAGGGKDPKPLCETVSLLGLEPAADGKSYFGVGHAHKVPDVEEEDATYRKWFRVNEKGEATLVKKFNDVDSVELRVSPDRKRVVLLMRTENVTLALYDADGSNEKKIVTLNDDGEVTRLHGWHGPK